MTLPGNSNEYPPPKSYNSRVREWKRLWIHLKLVKFARTHEHGAKIENMCERIAFWRIDHVKPFTLSRTSNAKLTSKVLRKSNQEFKIYFNDWIPHIKKESHTFEIYNFFFVSSIFALSTVPFRVPDFTRPKREEETAEENVSFLAFSPRGWYPWQ